MEDNHVTPLKKKKNDPTDEHEVTTWTRLKYVLFQPVKKNSPGKKNDQNASMFCRVKKM